MMLTADVVERDALYCATRILNRVPKLSRAVREQEIELLAESLRRVLVEHLASLGVEVTP